MSIQNLIETLSQALRDKLLVTNIEGRDVTLKSGPKVKVNISITGAEFEEVLSMQEKLTSAGISFEAKQVNKSFIVIHLQNGDYITEYILTVDE